MVVGPRGFITPPFAHCPHCGAEGDQGLLMVSDQGYVRRCRNCRAEERNHLPKLNKRIIYIDQFGLSKMLSALEPSQPDPPEGVEFWTDMFARLYRLVLLQLVVCPESSAHDEESRIYRLYEPLCQLYELLSAGVSFYDSATIRDRQMYEHVPLWLGGMTLKRERRDPRDVTDGRLDAWMDRLIISARIEYPSDWLENIRRTREETHEGLAEVFERWRQEGGTESFDDHLRMEVAKYGESFLVHYAAYLEQLAAGGPLDFPPSTVMSVWAVRRAFGDAGVADEDLESRCVEYFTSPKLLEVPYFELVSFMFTALWRKARSGQKKPPSRGHPTDVRTIAALLPYCDAMFIDKECRAHLGESPLRELVADYGTRLFSLNERTEFLGYLDDIESAAPRGHLELVGRVYGQDWGRWGSWPKFGGS